jgi:hypothetical protein
MHLTTSTVAPQSQQVSFLPDVSMGAPQEQ